MLIPQHRYTAREQTVCDILRPLEGCRTMLNVGMREPKDWRNQWWLKICEANEIRPTVLEAWPANVEACRAAGITDVITGDVVETARKLYRTFDIILWWHGPEHVERFRAFCAIRDLWPIADRALILGCPQGYHPQGVVNNNPYEVHRSQWEPDDFEGDFDMHTTVVNDGQLAPHITAWKIFDEI